LALLQPDLGGHRRRSDGGTARHGGVASTADIND